jgi:hypothetical protein
VMNCCRHGQVLVSKFLFCPPWTPCCLVSDIPIHMICYQIPMHVFRSYPWLSHVNFCYFDPYIVLDIKTDRTKFMLHGNAKKKKLGRVKNKAHGILPRRQHEIASWSNDLIHIISFNNIGEILIIQEETSLIC